MKKILLLFITLSLTQLAFGQDWKEKRSLGEQYQELGDLNKAQTLFEEAYKIERNGNTYKSLYDLYIQTENYDEAAKLSKDFAKRTSQLRFKIDEAYAYELADDNKKAGKVYEEIEEGVLDNPNQALNMAQRYVELQKLDLALSMYKIAQVQNPKANFHYQMADIYSSMGKMDLMFEEYLILIEENPSYLASVRNMLSRSVSKDPENDNNKMIKEALIKRIQSTQMPEYSDLLTWVYVQEQNFSSAVRQTIALDKRLKGNQSEVFQLAKVCETNLAYEDALSCYDYIINTVGIDGPFYQVAQIGILRVYQAQLDENNMYTSEDIQVLKTAYLKTIEDFGNSEYTVPLLRDLAHLEAFFSNDSEAAQALLEKALEQNNARPYDRAEVKIELADILLLKGQDWDAILLYAQVEKDFKEDVIGQEAKFRRARISYYQGDFQWAQAQLDVLKASTSKLIANDAMRLSLLISDNLNLDTTSDALTSYARAELLAYQQRYAEAISLLDTLQETLGGHTLIDEIIYKKGSVYFDMRDWTSAAKAYQTIVDSYSFDLLGDDAYYRLAKLYDDQLNDREKAFELYGDMLTKYPGSSYTVQARKRYREMRGDNPGT